MTKQEITKDIENYLQDLQTAIDELDKSPAASKSKKIIEEGRKSFQEIKKFLSNSTLSNEKHMHSVLNEMKDILAHYMNILLEYIGSDNVKNMRDSSKKIIKEGEKVIKDHPLSTLLIVFTIGILIGRR